MGNCIRNKTSNEDWGSFGSAGGSLPENAAAGGGGAEVKKIKISKKELEKLLKEADIEGLPVQQVLAHLMNASHAHTFEAHQRAWTPALHTIPESP